MNEKDFVSYILAKEIDISGIIHNAITETLRLGIDNERGNHQISNMIDGLEYVLDDIKNYYGRLIK